MEADEREGIRSKVRVLIENATNSTLPEVDPRLLTAIKTVVRYSDSELRIAAHTLLDLMKRNHSQVRFLTLLIIDQLFMRSKLFRSLIVEELDTLLTLSVGFRKSDPLPDPPPVATRLRSKAIEFLEKWNDSFGTHYRQIRLGFDYLKNTLRLQFPNLQANAARLRREREERERKSKEILLGKFESLRRDFGSVKEEIEATVREVGECLDIARGGDERVEFGPFDEEDLAEFRCSELRQIRASALEEGERPRESSENRVVFDALRELYKLVMTKHLVTVREWISVLVRVEVEDNKCRDSLLKELIRTKNDLQSAAKECEEAGFSLRSTTNVEEEEEEEDFWEEGNIGVSESENKNGGIASTSGETTKTDRDLSVEDRVSEKLLVRDDCRNQSNPLRTKLLAKAPVVGWGSQLADWGSKRVVLANQRGLDVEGHWGRVDYDAVIPAEKIAELNVQATIYKENHSEIEPCRAPLKKGGLCTRKDLRACPFHGPIVPRDDEGKPIDQDPEKEDETKIDSEGCSPINLALDLQEEGSSYSGVEQLAREAVKNVRERDKKDRDKERALKRAKLAKVREHNASVLKDAAMVSTSRSANVGENAETSLSAGKKKQGLGSMLRKKVTAKHRLSKRMSKGRTGEVAAIQLSMGEDANYRENFPNQW